MFLNTQMHISLVSQTLFWPTSDRKVCIGKSSVNFKYMSVYFLLFSLYVLVKFLKVSDNLINEGSNK